MKYNLELIKNKRKIIGFSTVLILLSLLGILYSTFNTSYKKPINLGMDFVGGNELRIERVCEAECSNFSPDSVLENLREISKNKNVLNNIKLQLQNNNKLISIRTPLRPGGGIIFGPKPRSYNLDMNRKERRLALRTALMSRVSDMKAVEDFGST